MISSATAREPFYIFFKTNYLLYLIEYYIIFVIIWRFDGKMFLLHFLLLLRINWSVTLSRPLADSCKTYSFRSGPFYFSFVDSKGLPRNVIRLALILIVIFIDYTKTLFWSKVNFQPKIWFENLTAPKVVFSCFLYVFQFWAYYLA